jgi:hypothetical protein
MELGHDKHRATYGASLNATPDPQLTDWGWAA